MAEGFFWGNDPNVNQQLRQRIAMSMMSQKKGYPKTLGEGLSAVGDAIGDIGMARMLERSDLAAQGVNPPPAAAPQQTSDAESVVKPEVLAYANPSDNTAEPAAQPAAASSPPAETEPGVAGSGYNALDAVANTDPWMARSKAIAGIESGGEKDPYRTLGTTNTHSGDRAYGKYQIMGKNIPSWTQAATGQALTPQQFLASPAAQEATFRHRFGQYADKYGDEGAARAWYAGEHGMNRLDATDLHERLSVRDYGRDFMNRMAPYNRNSIATSITPQPEQPSAALPLTTPDATVSDLPPEITQGFSARPPQQAIQQAPPQQPTIRQAPPLQVAQAGPQPQATPGYVPPEAPTPSGTPMIGMTPREIQLRNWLAANQGNPYAAAKVAPELGALEQARTVRQNEANELFKSKILQAAEQNKLRQQGLMDQSTRQAAGSMAMDNAVISSRTGQEPATFLANFAKDRDATEQAVNVLRQSKLAKQALNEGIVSGSGAEFRVNMEKLKGMFGNESAAQLAARSEQFLAAVKSTLNNAVQNIQGHDPKVTDSDVKVASGTIGADLSLQNATLHKLVDQTIESQHQRINKYEDLKDYYLSGTKNEKMYDVRTDQTASKPYVDRLLENKNEPAAIRQFDLKFGPGAAELEIARANRRARRPQSGGE